MHILVTNDDGVQSSGLLALVKELRLIGEVTVLAPDRNWSASGHVKTMHRPIRVEEVVLADGTAALASDGAPSDCVALALLGLTPDRPDLVVSGINPNANLGLDVTYSGTVTAALEAAIGGVPGISVSLELSTEAKINPDYTPAAVYARLVAERVIKNSLPAGTMISVNVPGLPLSEIKGVRITRQGLRVYRDQLVERLDPHHQTYYWIGGEQPISPALDGSDADALAAGYVSITPFQLDLTDYVLMEELKTWDWGKIAHDND